MGGAFFFDPAPVTAQIAGVRQGDEREGRIQFAFLDAALVGVNGFHAFETIKVRGLQSDAWAEFGEGTVSKFCEHEESPEMK